MTTQPTHAPTPWKVNERPVEISGSFLEIEGLNGFPTSILIERIHEDLSSRSAVRNWKEDAAFIVRACNGVEAILKTGDALLEKIGMIPGIEKERKAFIEALKAISND